MTDTAHVLRYPNMETESKLGHMATTLAEKVDAAMRDVGIATRGELAERCGIRESTLSESLSKASASIRLSTLLRLAKELHLSVEYLIEGIDPEYDVTRAEAPLQARVADLWQRAVLSGQAHKVWPILLWAAGAPDEPMPDPRQLPQPPNHAAVG